MIYGHKKRFIVNGGLLLLTCVFVAHFASMTSAAQVLNHPADEDRFARFSDANEASGPHSEVIKEFCNKAQVDVIHSRSYYKEKGFVTGNQEPPETIKAKQVLRGLSRIAQSAIRNEMDSQERLAVLGQLVRLETLVLTPEPLGSGNFEIGNDISLLISGLVFQEVADSEPMDLDSILPLAQRDILQRLYTTPRLKGLLDREIAYQPSTAFNSQHDLLASMLFQKDPNFAEKLMDKKNVDIDSVTRYVLFSHKPAGGKSMNPLIDVDPFMFVSRFMATRELELCARYSVLCRKLRENADDVTAFYSQFKEELVRGMTDFEKRILGSPETDVAMSRVTERIVGRIRDNLRDKGRNILELACRRFSKLSTDDGLSKETD